MSEEINRKIYGRDIHGNVTRTSPLYYSRDRLYNKQEEVIKDWKPPSEVWSLKYGGGIHGMMAMASSLWFTTFFRRTMKLRNLALYPTYLPTVVICGLTGSVIHSVGIVPKILLREEKCRVCTQIGAMSAQVFPGVIQPVILSFLITSIKARNYATVSMPAIVPFGPWYKFVSKNMRPMNRILPIVLMLNVGISMGITTMEQKHSDKVWDRMIVYADQNN